MADTSCCAPRCRPSRWRIPFAPSVRSLDPLAAAQPGADHGAGGCARARPRAASTPLSFPALPSPPSCWPCSAFTASSRSPSPPACRRWPSAWRSARSVRTLCGSCRISGLKLAAIGCVLGLAGAVAASGILRCFLFHVSPFDPVVLILATVAVFVLALAASALPARRAASVNPLAALRGE